MTEMTPDDLDTVARWHFAVGGLKTQADLIELVAAVRLERLKTFPTRTELTSHLNSPLVAGLMQHYGEDVDDVARYELKDGDVLMTEGGDFDKLGRGFVWDAQIPGCLHQNHVFAVRPKQDFLLPHYLAALMTSAHGKTYFTYTSQQSTNLASTNSTKLGNFPIPLPSVERQRSILKFIAERSGRINECIKRIHWGISSLTEYRSALIYAAVTGQIDVRQEVLLDS